MTERTKPPGFSAQSLFRGLGAGTGDPPDRGRLGRPEPPGVEPPGPQSGWSVMSCGRTRKLFPPGDPPVKEIYMPYHLSSPHTQSLQESKTFKCFCILLLQIGSGCYSKGHPWKQRNKRVLACPLGRRRKRVSGTVTRSPATDFSFIRSQPNLQVVRKRVNPTTGNAHHLFMN